MQYHCYYDCQCHLDNCVVTIQNVSTSLMKMDLL